MSNDRTIQIMPSWKLGENIEDLVKSMKIRNSLDVMKEAYSIGVISKNDYEDFLKNYLK